MRPSLSQPPSDKNTIGNFICILEQKSRTELIAGAELAAGGDGGDIWRDVCKSAT
jgi:hypothetical protein